MSGKFVKGHPLSDIVPVEGAFISSFLPSTSGVFVKVYLYLLYVCTHMDIKADSLSAVATASGVSEKEFTDALEFLSEKHLINYTLRPFTFEVLSAFEAKNTFDPYAADMLSSYSDYFAGIRALFPKRSISNGEYDKARDWVEIYGLSVETALLLVAHCISTADTSVSFSYIDKVALAWANDGITNAESAEEYLSLYQAKHHEASKLLRHLGISRTPSVDEMRLYRKWTSEMGFDLNAIKTACSETTKTSAPNFAYINRILEKLNSLSLRSAKEIRAYLTESDVQRRLASVILYTLGEHNRTVTGVHTEKLNGYKGDGFAEDSLILIAKLLCESGSHTFKKFCDRADTLRDMKAFTLPEIEKHFALQGDKKPQTPVQKKGSLDNFKSESTPYGDTLYNDPANTEV